MFSMNPNRNGLGDDSYFTWPDGKIPFVIGDGFNSTNKQNILDAVDYYNDIFGDCIKWIPKSDEVRIDNFQGLRNNRLKSNMKFE